MVANLKVNRILLFSFGLVYFVIGFGNCVIDKMFIVIE
jgi:hypothetical protein